MKDLLPFKLVKLDDGFLYLGFFIKPNSYGWDDWLWMIKKVSCWIDSWPARWLTMGVRLILIQLVLLSILVYWFSLFTIPASIVNNLRQLIFHFLWGGRSGHYKIHLTCWKDLSRTKHLGGWGVKDLRDFNKDLCAQILWRALFDKGLWGSIIQAKYLNGLDAGFWLGTGSRFRGRGSKIWRNLLSSLLIIRRSLCWEVGRGNMITIGTDPILGIGDRYLLSRELIEALQARGIHVFKQLWVPSVEQSDKWELVNVSDFPVDLMKEWSDYRLAVVGAGLHTLEKSDRLIWVKNPLLGNVMAKLAYDSLMEEPSDFQVTGIGSMVWNNKIPLRIGCFVWLAIQNKLLTWSNRHGFNGPGICMLCLRDGEDLNHLFGSCVFFQFIWLLLRYVWKSLPAWELPSTIKNLEHCFDKSRGDTIIVFYMLWEIWCTRNRLIFKGYQPCADMMLARIYTQHTGSTTPPDRDHLCAPPCTETSTVYPFGFFDGAAQLGFCGARMLIRMFERHSFHLCMGVGQGSNTRSELLALWGLLWFAEQRDIAISQIFSDSLCIIKWACGSAKLMPLSLQHWLARVRNLIQLADGMIFTHIQRCYNMEADGLSKQALGQLDGMIHYKEFRAGTLVDDSHLSFC